MKDINTIGDLKKLLADVPDDLPIAVRMYGAQWSKGFTQIGYHEIIVYGEGDDKLALSATDETLKNWKGPRSEPIRVVAFE